MRPREGGPLARIDRHDFRHPGSTSNRGKITWLNDVTDAEYNGPVAPHKSSASFVLNDPVEAIEIILLANHLLRIVDFRAKARSESE